MQATIFLKARAIYSTPRPHSNSRQVYLYQKNASTKALFKFVCFTASNEKDLKTENGRVSWNPIMNNSKSEEEEKGYSRKLKNFSFLENDCFLGKWKIRKIYNMEKSVRFPTFSLAEWLRHRITETCQTRKSLYKKLDRMISYIRTLETLVIL